MKGGPPVFFFPVFLLLTFRDPAGETPPQLLEVADPSHSPHPLLPSNQALMKPDALASLAATIGGTKPFTAFGGLRPLAPSLLPSAQSSFAPLPLIKRRHNSRSSHQQHAHKPKPPPCFCSRCPPAPLKEMYSVRDEENPSLQIPIKSPGQRLKARFSTDISAFLFKSNTTCLTIPAHESSFRPS